MDVGMHHAKNHGNKEIPIAILSMILAQSCVTPPYIVQAMIVLVSLIVGISHPIPTSPFIQLNDFCTCYTFSCCRGGSGENSFFSLRG